MADLLNKATVSGNYGGTTPMTVDTELTIQMVEINVSKTADHMIWGSGPLTYKITIENDEQVSLTGVVLNDYLEFTKVDFVENSVQINGTPTTAYTYDDTTGLLTVTAGTLAAETPMEITFSVTKK